MQIRLRPSGGRGEYELAGSHGAVRGADLYGLALEFDFGLDLRIPLYASADVHDGKPRIRLNDPHSGAHAARVIAALLLLPQPIREIRLTGGTSFDVDFDRCAFSSIVVNVVNKNTSKAILRPRTIVAINNKGASANVDVISRFEFIQDAWSGLSGLSVALLDAIAEHHAFATTVPIEHNKLIKAAEKVLAISEARKIFAPSIVSPDNAIDLIIAPPVLAEDDPSSPIEVNRAIRKRLAWRVERGPDGRKFQKTINNAYDYRCAFTGTRLPPLGKGYLPGVDAAHIYPWSRNGSNDVTNGISLSKQMHWAFDEGILRLKYGSTASNSLLIEIPDEVVVLSKSNKFDLVPYQAVCGCISTQNLPADPREWPSRKSLDLYNELMFPEI